MLNMTTQERQTILFLVSIALIGVGISLAIKMNAQVARVVRLDSRIIRIDINQASIDDLLSTQCVSPGLAKRIIDYRSQHGTFKTLEELKDVKGIGEYRFGKLKEIFYIP